jgi:hypothetical protein
LDFGARVRHYTQHMFDVAALGRHGTRHMRGNRDDAERAYYALWPFR